MSKLKTGLSQEKKDQRVARQPEKQRDGCENSRSREMARSEKETPADRGACEQESVTQGSE